MPANRSDERKKGEVDMQTDMQSLKLAIDVVKATQEFAAHIIEEERRRAAAQGAGPTGREEFVTLKEFLKEMHLSYASYRKLRAAGKTPPELRPSKNAIRISRAEISRWRAQRLVHPKDRS
jgi:hypothetical protein